MNKILPLKRFGQNFLQDQNIIRKIIFEINPKENELLIEIGPGQGALTQYLVMSNVNFTAVEIDKRVIEDLQNRFTNLKLLIPKKSRRQLRKFFKRLQKRLNRDKK